MQPRRRRSLRLILALGAAVAIAVSAPATAQGIRFRSIDSDVPFNATVGYDREGRPGLIGLTDPHRRGGPALNMRSRGLGPIFVTGDGVRDVRIVDMDSDGLPDIVANSKSDKAPLTAVLRLFRNRGNDRYEEDAAFRALDLRGFGESLVVADFDNDGCPDIFNPQYTFQDRCLDIGRPAHVDCRPGAIPEASGQAKQSFLLMNTREAGRCTARFREVAMQAGVSMHAGSATDPQGARPEGAQAIDFDDDGWLDLWVAGHLFMNRGPDASGVPRFVDASPRLNLLEWNGEPLQYRKDGPGLPPDCDGTRLRFPIEEGAQLLDWNNDGRFDLVVHHWACGPSLYELQERPGGAAFVHRPCASGSGTSCVPMFASGPTGLGSIRYTGNFGLKAQDLDGDGRVDIVVSGRVVSDEVPKPQGAVVYRNAGTGFLAVDAKPLSGLRQGRGGSVGFADFDRDGRVDVVYPTEDGTKVLINASPKGASAGTMYVEVLGPQGERNQFGRVVVFDVPGGDRKLMRVVDGGSGYLAQDEYAVLAPTGVGAAHRVHVGFRAAPEVPKRVVEFDLRPGEIARVFEPSRDAPRGRVDVRPVRPAGHAGVRGP